MALTQSLAQMRNNVRKLADAGGTNARVRHPDPDVNDYVNRGLASLHRKLNEVQGDQHYLSSTSISIVANTLTYSLPADFGHLISADITANGTRSWLAAYEMHERPEFTNPDSSYSGVPSVYRLRGASIEYLPASTGAYTSVLWYVPRPTTLTLDSQTFDTINRLDDYVIAYAARFIAVKDKNMELVALCKSLMTELEEDIAQIGRSRDRNSPPRVVDERLHNRWGRRRYGRRA